MPVGDLGKLGCCTTGTLCYGQVVYTVSDCRSSSVVETGAPEDWDYMHRSGKLQEVIDQLLAELASVMATKTSSLGGYFVERQMQLRRTSDDPPVYEFVDYPELATEGETENPASPESASCRDEAEAWGYWGAIPETIDADTQDDPLPGAPANEDADRLKFTLTATAERIVFGTPTNCCRWKELDGRFHTPVGDEPEGKECVDGSPIESVTNYVLRPIMDDTWDQAEGYLFPTFTDFGVHGRHQHEVGKDLLDYRAGFMEYPHTYPETHTPPACCEP